MLLSLAFEYQEYGELIFASPGGVWRPLLADRAPSPRPRAWEILRAEVGPKSSATTILPYEVEATLNLEQLEFLVTAIQGHSYLTIMRV